MPKSRKKSKYRHVIIKNKKYYFYSIKWLDITGDSGHAKTYGHLPLMKRTMSYFLIEMFFLKAV